MNYDSPQQREKDKRWDYTSYNNSTGCHPIGYCGGWRMPEKTRPHQRLCMGSEHRFNLSKAELEPFRNKYHTDGHATEEEAYGCYKQYLLDNSLRLDGFDPKQQNKCVVCDSWTQKSARIGYWFADYDLCDEHLNRETVETLFSVGDSWHS